MGINMKFEFREIVGLSNMDCFIKSWECAFSRKMDHKIYDWMFHERNHVFIASHEDSVIAGYCLLEIEAVIGGVLTAGLLCNNVFVNGFRYSKNGVFTKLTEFALDSLSEQFSFGLGFPNDKSVRSHLRAGWEIPFSLDFIEYRLDNLDYTDACLKVTTLPVCNMTLGQIADSFENLNNLNYSFFLGKSFNFLHWRFVSNPRYEYFFTSIQVGKSASSFIISKYFPDLNKVHIVDFCILCKKDIPLLINGMSHYYRSLGCEFNVIDLWSSDLDALSFFEYGFKSVGRSQPVIFKFLTDCSPMVDYSSFPHLVLSDNDVY